MAGTVEDTVNDGAEAAKKFFFWQNNPNINQELRQRIAASMMSNKKGHPKNIGEGLSAIGDSIGDIGLARMLERSADAEAKYGTGKVNENLTPPTPTATTATSEAVTEPPTEAVATAPAGTGITPPVQTAALPPPPPAVSNFPPVGNAAPAVTPTGAVPPAPQADPRAIITASIMQRQQPPAPGVPPQGPTQAGVVPPQGPSAGPVTPPRAGSPLDAMAAMPPGGDPTGQQRPPQPVIRQAPVPPQIQPAPQRLAQGGPPPVPGYVMPERQIPAQPPQVPLTDRQKKIINDINTAPPGYRQSVSDRLMPLYNADETQRAYKQNQLNEQWKADWKLQETYNLEREKQKAAATKDVNEHNRAVFDLEQARKKAAVEDRLGQPLDKFVEAFSKEHKDARTAAASLRSIDEIESAIRSGAITGFGQGYRVDAAKMKAWLFNNQKEGDIATNSDRLSAALKATVPLAIAKIQPGDPRVTEGDLAAAQGMSGTPTMQAEAILKLMQIAKEDVYGRVNMFEERRHRKVGGTALEDDFQLDMRPTASKASVDLLLKNGGDPATVRMFDEKFGPGAAKLELDRARRAAARRPDG